MPLDARRRIGTHDILFVTLDTLRFDVAQAAWAAGELPTLARYLPAEGWERRHSPATFTFAAHQAFFAGFLPTPVAPGRHPRLFAVRFGGSETTVETTAVFDQPTIVEGLTARGYHTLCVGGVGFFNPGSPLGKVLPGYFQEAHWSRDLGVTAPRSTEAQVDLVLDRLGALDPDRRLFAFINVSALHQPNHFYVPGATEDDLDTHRAALRYVDGALAPLFEGFAARGPTLVIVCSDHGTAYGEDGYFGHRISHPTVLDVPYAEFLLSESS